MELQAGWSRVQISVETRDCCRLQKYPNWLCVPSKLPIQLYEGSFLGAKQLKHEVMCLPPSSSDVKN